MEATPTLRSALVRRSVHLLLAVFAVAVLGACDTKTNSHPYWEDFSGTWDAQIATSTGGQFPVTIVLTQNGGMLAGTFTNGGAIHGTLTGTVVRGDAAFTIVQDPPCPGTFEGDVSLMGPDEFAGSYSGTGCQGPLTAELTGTRQ